MTDRRNDHASVRFEKPGLLGLEFAGKRGGGVILAKVRPGSRAADAAAAAAASRGQPIRRGMTLIRANGVDCRGATVQNIFKLIKRAGFPLTLTFQAAPHSKEDSAAALRVNMLLARMQRRFRRRLARTWARKRRAPRKTEKKYAWGENDSPPDEKSSLASEQTFSADFAESGPLGVVFATRKQGGVIVKEVQLWIESQSGRCKKRYDSGAPLGAMPPVPRGKRIKNLIQRPVSRSRSISGLLHRPGTNRLGRLCF